jgi:hypothetical protein
MSYNDAHAQRITNVTQHPRTADIRVQQTFLQTRPPRNQQHRHVVTLASEMLLIGWIKTVVCCSHLSQGGIGYWPI